MSVGTVTGGDRARVDPCDLAAVSWLEANGAEAAADEIRRTGRGFEADDLAAVVAQLAAPGDPRAAGLALFVVGEEIERLGGLRLSGDPERVEREIHRFLDIVLGLSVRTVRQRLALFGSPVRVLQRSLDVRPEQTVRPPRERCRVRTSGQRRRRSGRVRCGSPPGSEGDPEPDVDAAVALVLLLAGLGLPSDTPLNPAVRPSDSSGERVAFESFRPGWPSAVRSVLFGLLSDSAQAAYWRDLRLRGEAA